MSRKRVIGIVLCIAAVVVLAVGAFNLYSGHTKSGIGLLALGILAIAIGVGSFFSATAAERQPYREWIK